VGFRTRLLATLRAIQPVLDEPGVIVVGSEVPTLLALDAPAPLVISRDVDIAVPVQAHDAVKRSLRGVSGLRPAAEEPSVWEPTGELLEVNFLGLDRRLTDPRQAYVLEDDTLPLLVFGGLSLIQAGAPLALGGQTVPMPRPGGLALEKLLTDRGGEKFDRDLLVVAGLLDRIDEAQEADLVRAYASLPEDLRAQVRANATVLSLLGPVAGMPDPRPVRARVASLLKRLEAAG
jgi:hypothetical protein